MFLGGLVDPSSCFSFVLLLFLFYLLIFGWFVFMNEQLDLLILNRWLVRIY